MEIESLFQHALQMPASAIGHHVTRELSQRFPERAILFGTDEAFELEEFVHTMECPCEADHRVFQHVLTEWEGHGKGVKRATACGWYRIQWESHAIEVGLLTWSDCGYEERYHWVVAPSRSAAERFVTAVCDWSVEVRGEVLVFERGCWAKSEELYSSIKSATFDNLVLPAPLRQELEADFEQFFTAREIYERYHIPWKRGVLLLGPPGNGKTHTVKALINRLNKPCLYVKSFKARHANDHETMRTVFRRARQTTPCLLVMEDLDSLINDRNRAFFLNELDGFAANTGIMIVATTNHPERLDPAILDRPSRFDRKYTFALPAEAERAAYLAHWSAGFEPDLRLSAAGQEEAASVTEGFSYAFLKELLLSSMMRWIAGRQPGGMDETVRAQALLLREQVDRRTAVPHSGDGDDDDDEDS